MKCSIIIPTWQRSGLLRTTLDSLAQQTDQDFEVVVVCDGEDPQTLELSSRYRAPYPLLWIFSGQNEGQAAARNRDAQSASGEWLLFLDDDMVPQEDWILQHRKHHEGNIQRRGVAVWGKTVEIYEQPFRSRIEQLLRAQLEQSLAELENSCQQREMDFGRYACFGVNSSMRRETFLAVGGFDPALRFVEDFELGSRLHNQGIPLYYEPSARVCHRNTKPPIEYFRYTRQAWARSDLHRVRGQKQKNEMTVRLASMGYGSPARRLAHRLAWYWPGLFELGIKLCRGVMESTGSESFFRLWCRLHRVFYWESLKEQGVTLDWLRQCAGSPVAALAFPGVSQSAERMGNNCYVSPQNFRLFMEWLKTTGYEPIAPEEYLDGVASSRPVLLTFDDGREDFYWEVFPVLQRMGWKATVFLVADWIGQSSAGHKNGRKYNFLSPKQIREMHRYRVQFGSHSLTHPFLTRLSDQDLRREAAESKARLEDLLGFEVSCFAYPYGDVDLRVRDAIAEAGYKIAMTTQEGLNFWTDPLCLKRVSVGEADTLLEFALKLLGVKDYRKSLQQRLYNQNLSKVEHSHEILCNHLHL